MQVAPSAPKHGLNNPSQLLRESCRVIPTELKKKTTPRRVGVRNNLTGVLVSPSSVASECAGRSDPSGLAVSARRQSVESSTTAGGFSNMDVDAERAVTSVSRSSVLGALEELRLKRGSVASAYRRLEVNGEAASVRQRESEGEVLSREK